MLAFIYREKNYYKYEKVASSIFVQHKKRTIAPTMVHDFWLILELYTRTKFISKLIFIILLN